jgi:hypothetical protein
MSSNSVVLASSFSTSNVTFSPLRVLDSGGKHAFVNYNKGMCVMQTPSCVLPYGMNSFDKAGPIKYSVELSMRDYEVAGSKMKEFYDALVALDEFMIDQGVKNSRQWFKADMNRDVVRAFYTPLVRFSVDKEGNRKPYPPTFKLQLRQRDGEFETKMYDDRKQPYHDIPVEDLLVKGAQVTALIQCTGMWFAGSKFGLSWKANQIRVDNLPQSSRGMTFVDDGEVVIYKNQTPSANAPAQEEEEEEEEDEAFTAPAPQPTKSRPSVVAAVAPQEEEEEEEDAEPVVVPKKPAVITKKKIVTKK